MDWRATREPSNALSAPPLPRRGRPGRPTLVEWPDIVIVQVVKHRTRHTFDLCRRIVQGTQPLVDRLLRTRQGGGVINTAFIERLNAARQYVYGRDTLQFL